MHTARIKLILTGNVARNLRARSEQVIVVQARMICRSSDARSFWRFGSSISPSGTSIFSIDVMKFRQGVHLKRRFDVTNIRTSRIINSTITTAAGEAESGNFGSALGASRRQTLVMRAAKVLAGLFLLFAACIALLPSYLSTQLGLNSALAITNGLAPGHLSVQKVNPFKSAVQFLQLSMSERTCL